MRCDTCDDSGLVAGCGWCRRRTRSHRRMRCARSSIPQSRSHRGRPGARSRPCRARSSSRHLGRVRCCRRRSRCEPPRSRPSRCSAHDDQARAKPNLPGIACSVLAPVAVFEKQDRALLVDRAVAPVARRVACDAAHVSARWGSKSASPQAGPRRDRRPSRLPMSCAGARSCPWFRTRPSDARLTSASSTPRAGLGGDLELGEVSAVDVDGETVAEQRAQRSVARKDKLHVAGRVRRCATCARRWACETAAPRRPGIGTPYRRPTCHRQASARPSLGGSHRRRRRPTPRRVRPRPEVVGSRRVSTEPGARVLVVGDVVLVDGRGATETCSRLAELPPWADGPAAVRQRGRRVEEYPRAIFGHIGQTRPRGTRPRRCCPACRPGCRKSPLGRRARNLRQHSCRAARSTSCRCAPRARNLRAVVVVHHPVDGAARDVDAQSADDALGHGRRRSARPTGR